MKKKWNLLYVAIATVLLLAACGTGDAGNETKSNQTDGTLSTGEDTDDVTVDEDDVDSDEQSTDTEDTNSEDEATKENRPDSTVLTYNDGETDKSKEAVLTESDEQDYSLYLLPLYQLTSEEPGRDILYLNEKDSIFMRIETMTAEEGTYEYAIENTLAVLEASVEGATPEEIADSASLPTGEGIEDAKGFLVNSETGPVTGLVFIKDKLVIKLTVFDSPKAEHYEAFLRMAETIVKK